MVLSNSQWLSRSLGGPLTLSMALTVALSVALSLSQWLSHSESGSLTLSMVLSNSQWLSHSQHKLPWPTPSSFPVLSSAHFALFSIGLSPWWRLRSIAHLLLWLLLLAPRHLQLRLGLRRKKRMAVLSQSPPLLLGLLMWRKTSPCSRFSYLCVSAPMLAGGWMPEQYEKRYLSTRNTYAPMVSILRASPWRKRGAYEAFDRSAHADFFD